MKRNLSIILGLFFVLASAAHASPLLCAKAIAKLSSDVISVVNTEHAAFKKDCAAKIACKKECKDARKAVKKELKAFKKGCKKECKSAYKSAKGKDKKKAKSEKKSCNKMCTDLYKAGKKFSKDSKANKCGQNCRPKVTEACKSAQKKLATKILTKAPIHAFKIAAACAVPAP